MVDGERERKEDLELSEIKKSMDSFLVGDPMPIETPMSAQTDDATSPQSSAADDPAATPPTDFDG